MGEVDYTNVVWILRLINFTIELTDYMMLLYLQGVTVALLDEEHLRPVIDSKINHTRHFIKIPSINKGMDFIDLPSIFRDKSVQSSIPNYFKNCKVPIICYKYNQPIRGAIFNFNKLVSDLDIETYTPDSRACKDSKYVYPAAGHVITGNLKIISDSRIRSIIAKGPKI